MKFIAIILALYVMVLSIRPYFADSDCTDSDHCTQTAQTSNSHQHDNDCKGDCSPFFTCAACSGFNIPTVSFSLIPLAFILTEKVSIYNPSFISEFLQSIWQPPKISECFCGFATNYFEWCCSPLKITC